MLKAALVKCVQRTAEAAGACEVQQLGVGGREWLLAEPAPD